ncbi:MAG: hypothetical protein IJM23_09915 [Lachnospiraceae bacterium]|nr:hypothetical protein [Lachnospiraceae bacterium]
MTEKIIEDIDMYIHIITAESAVINENGISFLDNAHNPEMVRALAELIKARALLVEFTKPKDTGTLHDDSN